MSEDYSRVPDEFYKALRDPRRYDAVNYPDRTRARHDVWARAMLSYESNPAVLRAPLREPRRNPLRHPPRWLVAVAVGMWALFHPRLYRGRVRYARTLANITRLEALLLPDDYGVT